MRNDTNSLELAQATIEECPFEPQDPFTVIPNSLLRDASISPNCRWLICYLLSNKQGWKINIAQIVKHVRPHLGRDKVYDCLNEAIHSGYIKKENIPCGNLTRVTYHVSKSARFKKCFRLPGFQEPEAQAPENTHIKNTIVKKYYKKENIDTKPSARVCVSSSRKKIKEEHEEVEEFVHLTPTQQSNLTKKLKGDLGKVKKCYEILSTWKIGKGVGQRRNDYMAICNWVIDCLENEIKGGDFKNKNIEEDKRLAARIWERLKGRTDIHLGNKYIEFVNGPICEHLEFGSKDFRKKCSEQLEKRKIRLES